MTGTLTTILEAMSPNGTKDAVKRTEVLTEAALLRAGTSLISQVPLQDGWVVISLRAVL